MAGPWTGLRPREHRAASPPLRPQHIYDIDEPALETAIARRLHPLRHAARIPLIGALFYGPLFLAYVVFVAPTGPGSTRDDVVAATVIMAALLVYKLITQYSVPEIRRWPRAPDGSATVGTTGTT